MKKITLLAFAFLMACPLVGQTIWDGPPMTFTKDNFADPLLEANQDRITDIVWITRADIRGIFNAFSETVYTNFSSPADTQWAFGTTADIGTLTFENWEDAIESLPLDALNQDMVLHLITDDIYIDIEFTQWSSGGSGGGFTYTRSTDPSLSTDDFQANSFAMWPNPANDILNIRTVDQQGIVDIYDIGGRKVLSSQLTAADSSLDIANLNSGLYFVTIDNQIKSKLIVR